MKLSEEYTKKPYSFLVNNITLPSDNPLRFRRDVLLKEVLVRKLKQLITKWIEPKFHTIQTDKLLRFLLYHQQVFVNMNF